MSANMEETDVNPQTAMVTDNYQTPNNPDDNVVDNSGATPDVDFTAGSFVPQHNPTAELTSMLSSLYLSDTDDKTDDDDDETASCLFNANIIQTLQADIDKLKGDFFSTKSTGWEA